MRRISDSRRQMQGGLTRATGPGRRILLAFCLVCGIAAVTLSALAGRFEVAAFLPFAGALLVWQWQSTFTGLVDDVYDAGDALVMRDGRDTERVPLSGLADVDFRWCPLSGSSQRVLPVLHLTLRESCRFGSAVRFIARTAHSGPSAAAQEAAGERMAEDLRRRIDRA
ncbi:hypothetical protein KBTX_00616 [wastewater metagenome]|uniref:Uncharacterized protein n=2 Tax=unclassified sequences TaxID=12908 RepID=A0A5B8R8N9_9ZZZZ|nr:MULTISPECIES: hypothetical protein [Arhodomonas]MCS4505951.1 hypothetical protein [Arhodomonas aquaeolei]QEA04308.1 hypothetical protein KBTEX_00616 [uncultured organism]